MNWSLGQEKPGREGGPAGITVEAAPRLKEEDGVGGGRWEVGDWLEDSEQ